eukprot:CAMPEP_0116867342 /NCGR_PEP_ID=MMETSP0418-20121206/26564_1 /TAXON_ID=1158023 /ORGANISM="Astrosyne radiata, Strain 13vi08-1A" /LENGTH=166 /DNA_ID=CAMNT_0004503143 /DNA_START=55 /DNA_END=555 /DNA_ORIENTATION=+
MTIISFLVAVAATEKKSGSVHFSDNDHSKAGLVIFLFSFVQVAFGIARPPAPKKNDDGTMGNKQPVRMLWEFGHRVFGIFLLAFCWWQVQDGLKLYAFLFNADDLSPVFWGIAAGLSGIIFLLYVYDKVLAGDDDGQAAHTVGKKTDDNGDGNGDRDGEEEEERDA